MYRSHSAAISRSFKNLWAGSSRTARSHQPRTIDPELTRQALLHNYKVAHGDYSIAGSSRNGKFAWNVRYSLPLPNRARERDPRLCFISFLCCIARYFSSSLSKCVAAVNYIVTQWKLFVILLISCQPVLYLLVQLRFLLFRVEVYFNPTPRYTYMNES